MSAAERRESVLETAVAEFALHGLAGTSTEDVARRAGISQPYLFRLFPTKKALFLALVDRCFQRVRDAFTAAVGDLTGEEAKMAMADAYERLLDDRILLLLQMQAYAACEDPEIRAATRAGFKKLWELVERCFRRVRDEFAAAAGELTGEEAMTAMADAYEVLLDDRILLLLQMQAYAACEDPEIRDATRTGFRKLWEQVERITGLPYQTVVDFFAVGMLMNVAAAMNLPEVDERWTSWCPKPKN